MITITKNLRQCQYCGAKIEGRHDKKFCDDNCRNNYYYKLNNEDITLVRNVNSILLHNRKILKSFNNKGKTIVLKQTLVEKNFNFQYFTGIYRTNKGTSYYLIYDQAYSMIDDVNVALVRFCHS